jgi:hypothetical protein
MLKTAFQSEPDSAPNILLVNDPNMVNGPMPMDPTEPPVADLSGYPFLSKSLEDLSSFLDTISEDWPISTFRFLVVDEQSAEDGTVLFVERGHRVTDKPQTVRLDYAHANAIPIAVQVATMDLGGIREISDENGVYRGSTTKSQPREGGFASRKQLISTETLDT